MDPSRDTQDAVAEHGSRIPTSDDANHTSAYPFQTHFPRHPRQRGNAVPSPPHEVGHHGPNPDPKPLYPPAFPIAHNANSLGGQLNRPLTPPRQDDEGFTPLREWFRRERAGLDSSGLQQMALQVYPAYAQPSLPPQQEQQDYAPRQLGNQFEAPYGTYRSRYSPKDFEREPAPFHTGSTDLHLVPPSRLGSIDDRFRPPLSHLQYTPPSQSLAHIPPVQQWSTHDLTHQGDQGELDFSALSSVAPSHKRRKMDEKSRQKQEVYRRKGEARRKAREERTQRASQADQGPKKGQKRKHSSTTDTTVPPTVAPAFQNPNFFNIQGIGAPQPNHLGEPVIWDHTLQCYVPSTLRQPEYRPAPVSHAPSPYTPFTPAPVPGPKPWDDIHQSITSTYEDYKWSIKLYELDPNKGYAFAQSFVEELFTWNKLYEPDSPYKWHAHTTQGFIKDGTRLSFIVLHNAVNPFTWGSPPDSSTTLGVYGRYGNAHDKQIYWKTFAPDIRAILQSTVDQGYCTLKHTWRVDMIRASDKRFHRAYWLAANRLPLKGLLNHCLPDEPPHDAIEDIDDDFEVSERDMQTSWDGGDVDEEQAALAWQNVLRENEENDGMEGGIEHVVTGCSEWDQGNG